MSDDEPDNLEPAEAMMAEVPGAEMTDAETDEIFSAAWERDEGDEGDEADDASDGDSESGAEVTPLDEAHGDETASDGGHWRGSIAAAAVLLLATAGTWVGYRWIA
ncbi:MAG: hypothetical protein ABEN55_08425, partial [Bradymonadaceae bacterium]